MSILASDKTTRETFKESILMLEKQFKNTAIIAYEEDLRKLFGDNLPQNFIYLQNIKESFMEIIKKTEIPVLCLPIARLIQSFDPVILDGQSNLKIVGIQESNQNFIIRDFNFMRSYEKIIILNPCDEISAYATTKFLLQHNGSVYLRISGNIVPALYKSDAIFEVGRAIILKEGKNVALIGTGRSIHEVLEASEELSEFNPWVIDMPTIKPVDRALIKSLTHSCSFIVTVEEHAVVGGLGSSIAEVLAEKGFNGKLLKIGQEIASNELFPSVDTIVKSVQMILQDH